jgi:hypothetical protein
MAIHHRSALATALLQGVTDGFTVDIRKWLAQRIAQADSKVTKPSGMSDTPNGTALVTIVELVFGPAK